MKKVMVFIAVGIGLALIGWYVLQQATTGKPAAATTYSLSEVARHNKADDCWTAINGKVYDLTSFIPTHPGGDRILAACGIDGTSAFSAQHSQNSKPQQQLGKLQIGELRQ